MRLRIGVVGLGDAWDSRHRPAFRSMVDRFELRAVTSPVQRLAEQAAMDFQCHVVGGFQSLAAREDVDAIMLLGREWYGPLPILAACDRGKAVYCTTTFDLSSARVGAIKKRVDAAGIAFMAELPRRHAPASLRLKELIATHLGQPTMMFCHQRAAAPQRRSQSSGTPSMEGQSQAELSLLEQLDWCRYIMEDEICGVQSVLHRSSSGEVDYQLLSLDFRNKQGLAHVSFGKYIIPQWAEAASFRPPADLQVCCERGVAFVDLPSRVTWFDEAGRHHESLENDRPAGEQLLHIFHRSVTSLIRRTSGLEDACLALHVLDAARKSVAEQRRVPIDLVVDPMSR